MLEIVIGWAGRVVVGLACVVMLTSPAVAAPGSSSGEEFPLFEELAPNVEFWTDVFSVYSSNQAVYHDMYDLGLVYRVVDFSDIVDGRLSEVQKEA